VDRFFLETTHTPYARLLALFVEPDLGSYADPYSILTPSTSAAFEELHGALTKVRINPLFGFPDVEVNGVLWCFLVFTLKK
jgi:hypothetical protein